MLSTIYINPSIENGWADLADSFIVVFVIVRKRFLRKKTLVKSTRKVIKLTGFQKYNSKIICLEKNKLNNKKFSLLVAIS